MGILRDRYLLMSIGITVLLEMAVVYAPFMQVAFHTVPIGAARWGIAIGVAGALFTAEELRKVIAPKLFSRGKWLPA